jgi:hypothetical protein
MIVEPMFFERDAANLAGWSPAWRTDSGFVTLAVTACVYFLGNSILVFGMLAVIKRERLPAVRLSHGARIAQNPTRQALLGYPPLGS